MTAGLELYRLSGGGNDFLALAEPRRAPNAERIRAWCTRGLSLGADGLFVLRRLDGEVTMDYFNADGHPAQLCLNGTRCAARLAFHLGWATDRVEIRTGAGVVIASASDGDDVRLDLAPPRHPPVRRTAEIDGTSWGGFYCVVGVPVFVLPWRGSLRDAPVAELGARLRAHPTFGDAGANVMFVHRLPSQRLEIRSYERGVEAETLACGTGVLAASSVAVVEGCSLPIQVLTGGGCEFVVDGEVDSEGHLVRWSLEGDARLLARLSPEDGAERLPEPPAWT
jgi:diaminopimelate epimerase